MAGAGGFEPPVTGPKPVALPLGYAPPQVEYRPALEASPAVKQQHRQHGGRHEDQDDYREDLGDLPEHGHDHRDQLRRSEDPGDVAERLEARSAGDDGIENDRGRCECEHPEPAEPAQDDEQALGEADQEGDAKPSLAQPETPAPPAVLDHRGSRHSIDVTKPVR